MQRSIISILSACTISVLAVLPAAASDPSGSVPADFNMNDSLKETGGSIYWAPVRLPAAAVAAVAGTPVAVFRKECQEISHTVKGGLNHPLILFPALTLGLAGAILGGVADGLVAGPADAFGCYNHPFSKDSFSLGEMYDSYHSEHE